MRVDRFDGAVCACCARRATGIGYSPDQRKEPLWLCDDRACIDAAKASYFMKQDQFDSVETLAMRDGGDQGGQYLDTIGKSDLATLTEPEWNEFLRRIIAGYRKSLLDGVKDEIPF